jgi:hypothetical protein
MFDDLEGVPVRRREVLTALGMTAVGLTTLAGGEAQGHPSDPKQRQRMEKCIQACLECVKVSGACYHECAEKLVFRKTGYAQFVQLMNLANDCADLAAATAKLVARHSFVAAAVCEACAKACETCAQKCLLSPEEESVAAYGKVCQECARACREIVKAEQGHDQAKPDGK